MYNVVSSSFGVDATGSATGVATRWLSLSQPEPTDVAYALVFGAGHVHVHAASAASGL